MLISVVYPSDICSWLSLVNLISPLSEEEDEIEVKKTWLQMHITFIMKTKKVINSRERLFSGHRISKKKKYSSTAITRNTNRELQPFVLHKVLFPNMHRNDNHAI